jgi:hypothetical protein
MLDQPWSCKCSSFLQFRDVKRSTLSDTKFGFHCLEKFSRFTDAQRNFLHSLHTRVHTIHWSWRVSSKCYQLQCCNRIRCGYSWSKCTVKGLVANKHQNAMMIFAIFYRFVYTFANLDYSSNQTLDEEDHKWNIPS